MELVVSESVPQEKLFASTTHQKCNDDDYSVRLNLWIYLQNRLFEYRNQNDPNNVFTTVTKQMQSIISQTENVGANWDQIFGYK